MKTTLTAGIVCLAITSGAHAQQAVQWKVSDGGNGHWYQLTAPPNRINVGDAATASIQRGGDLASVGSTAENQFVFALAAATPSLWTLVWTGATQISGPWIGAHYVDGAWQWSDGNAWNFANWSLGNPNYLPGESAVVYMGEANGPPTNMWNNIYPDYLNWGYVIEWSADCNNDGIVDYGQCYDGTLPDYNGNNVPDCCERGEACVVGNYPVQWRIEDGGNGHWYQIRAKVGDWFACRAAAQGLTGDLASPSTVIENSFVERLVPPKQFPIWNRVFLGGRQNNGNAPNEGWYWVDGSAWNYVDWFENQPNGGEGFLVTMPDESGCTWGDYPANSSDIYYFMAEWDADCNNDGIVDYGQVLQGQLADLNSNGIPDVCEQPTCVDADLFRDFNVNGADLGILLSQWGPNTALTVSDINKDGFVNGADLGVLLAFWGACPN